MTTLLKAGMVLEQKNRDPDGRRRGPSRYYPTFEGYEYLERHRHRTQTWLRDNWFPLSIAVISSIIGIANVVLAVLNQTP